MLDNFFSILQRVGRSFMLPIAILPIAGLLLGLGSCLTDETMLRAYHLEAMLGDGTILYALLIIMKNVGSAIFDNLPLIFAVGVAIGMAKREKQVAALSAVLAYFVMHTSINAMLQLTEKVTQDGAVSSDILDGTVTTVCGILTLQMGVFGGIIVGLGVAALHNRFYKLELPNALSFFGGTHFVPIISTVVFMFVGILMYFIWPTVQSGIYCLGGLVTGTGYFGTLVFGIIKRALIPFGLHHVFYMPFWQTAVGGTMEVAGETIQGGQNIFFAQLADSKHIAHFSAEATRYFSGEFIFMIFGLPGGALAMYHCAKPERKKQVGGLLLSAALACMLTGITEPLEFSFLFVAPALFVVQVILAGAAYMIAHMLNIAVGLTFSGGMLDFILFGVLQGNEKTNWIRVIPVGMLYFVLYYVVFRFLILKFDFKTPGREDEDDIKLYTKKDVQERKSKRKSNNETSNEEKSKSTRKQDGKEEDLLSAILVKGLGGEGNIVDIDCCATRLRCSVMDSSKVDQEILKSTNPTGIVSKGQAIQLVYGPQVAIMKSNLEDYLEKSENQVYSRRDVIIATDQNKIKKKAKNNKKENKKIKNIYKRKEIRQKEDCRTKEIKKQCDDFTRQEDAFQQEKSPTKKTIQIGSPVSGEAVDLGKVPDKAFASRMMGDGAAVIPQDPIVVAPEDGEASFIFDTKHAIGFVTDSGVSVLLHIGIDTVRLEGRGFEVLVQEGQKLKKGDPMIKLDLDYLNANTPSMMSPFLCTELKSNESVHLLKEGKIKGGEALFEIIST